MLTAEFCLLRRQTLIERAKANLLVITNPRHIHYLCNFYISPLALAAWGRVFLVLDPYNEKSTLIVNNGMESAAQAAFVDEVVVWPWYDARTQAASTMFGRAVDELNLRLPIGGRRVAGEKGWLPWDTGASEVQDLTPLLHAMRRHKYPDELALIYEVARVNTLALAQARAAVKVGVSEMDIHNTVYSALTHEVGLPVHFLGDFTTGARSAETAQTSPATLRTLEAGDVMIIDSYPVIYGYRADNTMTVSATGELSPRQRALEAALHDALAAGEFMLKAGVRAADVYQAVYTEMEKHGFGAAFNHHAGHGLGLGHPEAPYLVPESEEVLQAGDVVTLEPGAYTAEAAGRIEHHYWVTETGCQRISQQETRFSV